MKELQSLMEHVQWLARQLPAEDPLVGQVLAMAAVEEEDEVGTREEFLTEEQKKKKKKQKRARSVAKPAIMTEEEKKPAKQKAKKSSIYSTVVQEEEEEVALLEEVVEPSSNNGMCEHDIAHLLREAEGELADIQTIAKGEGAVLLNVPALCRSSDSQRHA